MSKLAMIVEDLFRSLTVYLMYLSDMRTEWAALRASSASYGGRKSCSGVNIKAS